VFLGISLNRQVLVRFSPYRVNFLISCQFLRLRKNPVIAAFSATLKESFSWFDRAPLGTAVWDAGLHGNLSCPTTDL
jgi:hypothetical protein